MEWGFREGSSNPEGSADRLWLLERGGADALPARAPDAARRLRLFHSNDLHARFVDFPGDGPPAPRFGRYAVAVAAARRAAGPDEAVLFVSGGDDHVGTVLDELNGWSADDFVMDPAFRMLSAAGLDASTIGNHDFDRGAEVLACCAREAAFPLLCANLGWAPAPPAAIVEAKGLRVGVIGLITATDTRPRPGIALSDPAETLAALAPVLGAQADLLIVLSHCGRHVDLDLAPILAERASCPAMIVGAHTHHALNRDGLEPRNCVAGVPILQAGCKSAFLGEALWSADGPRETSGLEACRLIAFEAAPEAGAAETAAAAPAIAALGDRLRKPIGVIEGEAGATPAVLAERYGRECALANLFADVIVERAGVGAYPPLDLAMVNATYFAAGLGPGPVTMGGLCEAAPYAETVWVADVTSEELLAILASNARRALRPEEGPPPEDGFVHRGFLHFSRRLRYAIRLGADAEAARVEGAAVDGAPLAAGDGRRFALGLTTYLAHGGFREGWNGEDFAGRPCPSLPALIRCDTGTVHRAEVARWLSERGAARPACDGRLTLLR